MLLLDHRYRLMMPIAALLKHFKATADEPTDQLLRTWGSLKLQFDDESNDFAMLAL